MTMDDFNFELDPQIRNWVLFPITLVMILVGILRHHIMQLLKDKPKQLSKAATREQRALARAQILRATASNSPLPPQYYHSISRHLSDAFEAGTYLKDSSQDKDKPSAPANPMTDPAVMENMMSGMKTQVVMMVPQMLIMGWVNFFFSGFVLIKLPFPLTVGFKSMLQRGIDTPDMDVRWVSSLSWYFLNFFGLNGVYRLLLGNDNAADSSQSMSQSPFAAGGGGAPTPGQPQDYGKLFKSEKSNLQLSEGLYKWIGDDIEEKVLRRYGKM